jgi:hypothetical protein
VQHITAQQFGSGVQITCHGCGASVLVGAPWQAEQFQAMHAQCAQAFAPVDPNYYGAGDAVAAVAQPIARAIGRDPDCLPCAKRKRALNRWLPRLFRRR